MQLTRRALRAQRKATMSDNTDPAAKTDALNKNLVFAAICIMIVLGLVGVILLQFFRPDATATLVQTIVQFAGILTTLVTLLYGLGKVGGAVEQVRKQTNGTLSKLQEENARLHEDKTALALRLDPEG